MLVDSGPDSASAEGTVHRLHMRALPPATAHSEEQGCLQE